MNVLPGNLSHEARDSMKKLQRVEAQQDWRRLDITKRLQFLPSIRDLLAKHSLQLAELCGAARRCSVAEAICTEVLPLADAARFLQKNARAILKPKNIGAKGRPVWLGRTCATISREPYGEILVIGPGNYPLFLAGVQALQALVAGNAVIIKPGVGGHAVMLLFCDLLMEAGINPQLISLLSDSVESAVEAIKSEPDKVIFTGSVAAGRTILTQLASQITPATMELSGSDAVIICSDADLRCAAEAVAFGITLNGGATCIAPRRIFIPAARLEEFEILLCENLAPREWRLGEAAASRVRDRVTTALRQGARLVHGRMRSDGNVFAPLILSSVQPHLFILQEDIFDPILSIIPTVSEGEAITLANNSRYALGAAIFSSDQNRAANLAAKIHAGIVCINDIIVPTADPRLPFGGAKKSGFGVTRGSEGLLDMTIPKVVTTTRGKFRPAYKTPRKGDEHIFADYLKLTHGAELTDKFKALAQLGARLISRSKQKDN